MSRHESPEIGAMIGRMLNALIRRAAEGDWEALEALAEIERLAPAAMTAGLVEARDIYSLGELAPVLGVTRGAIHQRTSAAARYVNHTPILRTDASGIAWHCGHTKCVGVKRCRELAPLTRPAPKP